LSDRPPNVELDSFVQMAFANSLAARLHTVTITDIVQAGPSGCRLASTRLCLQVQTRGDFQVTPSSATRLKDGFD
jgi:hypothetical protein